MRLHNQHGFTFIEIVVVIVIIGVLSVIAIPSFLNWMPNIRLKSNARDLYSDIQNAKLEAAKRSSCIGVRFTTVAFPATGGGYTVFLDNGNGTGTACNGVQDGTETTLRSKTVATRASLVSASNMGGPSTVCFAPTTVVCGSQSGNIQLRNNTSRWYRVVISAAGGTSLESSTDGVNWSN
ncbi:GspH/FimT family pseudopilin [Desulfosediminicola flagellatus]|uniref:GspH/FimT family pseudopilin n=1 Tax=Desulfosediminicola flagellatus TaxID=2569541 RepID=UPI001593C037|nr:GspH/FimT family protein [Desulfosediminicola flagellatus]